MNTNNIWVSICGRIRIFVIRIIFEYRIIRSPLNYYGWLSWSLTFKNMSYRMCDLGLLFIKNFMNISMAGVWWCLMVINGHSKMIIILLKKSAFSVVIPVWHQRFKCQSESCKSPRIGLFRIWSFCVFFVSYVVSRLSLADGAILPVGINMGRGVAWRQKHLEITTDFVCVRPNPAKSPRYLLEKWNNGVFIVFYWKLSTIYCNVNNINFVIAIRTVEWTTG